jgi:hypothetical protein
MLLATLIVFSLAPSERISVLAQELKMMDAKNVAINTFLFFMILIVKIY